MSQPHPTPRVAGIFVYPIKSTRGRALAHATVEPWGLGGDRRWALIDHPGWTTHGAARSPPSTAASQVTRSAWPTLVRCCWPPPPRCGSWTVGSP
jgi:uncharacterized protein YcbX